MTDKFSKLYIALKFRLKGMGFYEAMRALEFAREIHSGLRKDGITPEFQHQLEICHYLMTLKGIEDLEGVIIAGLLHDTDEDYPHLIPLGELQSYGPDRATAVRTLNKNRFDSDATYYEAVGRYAIASIVKGVDNINNFQSMNRGKFTIEKQTKRASNVIELVLPMLKLARKRFPRQMDAYYNIEYMLKSQHELIQLLLQAQAPIIQVAEKPAVEMVDADTCPECRQSWDEHDFGVPRPFCP